MAIKNTAVISISLPKAMKERIKKRVEQAQYGTPSDYIRTLVREDFQKQEGQGKLEKMLLEGIRSGRGGEIGGREWNTHKKEVLGRLAKKR